jgi:branched-chain amino acid transport system ATP-binding protein
MSAPGLVVESLTAGYGGLTAIRGVELASPPGEILALIGPNGAGKTTTLHAIVGLLPVMAGRVRLDGEDLGGLSPHEVARRGVILIPGDRGIFRDLTVAEHLRLAERSRAKKAGSGGGWSADDVLDRFPSLARRLRNRAGDLSGGEQQMLTIAKSMMMGPKVLLIDELSLGLAPLIVEEMLGVVREIVDTTHMAVVLVEQHYELSLAIADQGVVLSHGEVALAGRASELIKSRENVEAVYLARDAGSR